MNLIKNNIKAIIIHMCYIPIFLIGLIAYVVASPLYQLEIVSLIIAIILYFLAYVGYIALNMKYLKLSKSIFHDFFSGIGVVILSLLIWAVTYRTYFPISESYIYDEIWIPYNIYNFLLWPALFRIEDHRIMMYISLLNGAYAPVAIGLKRFLSRHASK